MRLQVLLPALSCLFSMLLIPIRTYAQEENLSLRSEVHAQIYQYLQERQEQGLPTEPIADISSFWGVWQTESGTPIGFYPALPIHIGNVNVDRVCLLSHRGSDESPSGFSEALDFQAISDLEPSFPYQDDVDLTLPALRARFLVIDPETETPPGEKLPLDTFEGFSSYVQNSFEGHYFMRLGDDLIWFTTMEAIIEGDADESSGEREIKEIKRILAGNPRVLSFVGELSTPEAFLSEDFTPPEAFFYPENSPTMERQDNYVLQMFHAAGCRLSIDEPLPYPFPQEIGNLNFETVSQTVGDVTIRLIGGNRTNGRGYPVEDDSSSFRFDAYILIENQSSRSFSFRTSQVGLAVEGIGDLRNCDNDRSDFPGCSTINRFETYTRQATVQPGGSLVGKLIRDQGELPISDFLAPQVSILVEEACVEEDICRDFSLPLRLSE